MLRDTFHDSPRPCEHTPAPTLPGGGACGKEAAVVYTSLDTQPLPYLTLKYTSAVINRHVRHARDVCVSPGVLARSGSMIASVKTLDHVKTRMILLFLTRCVRQAVVVYIRLQNTIGSIPACIAQIGGAHVFPDVLATLGSTIGPMTALVHAPVPRLVIVRHEARAAIERRWCV